MKLMLTTLSILVLLSTHVTIVEGSESKGSESKDSDAKTEEKASTSKSGSTSKSTEPSGSGSKESDTKAEEPVQKSGSGRPIVVIETSMGTITAELWPDKSPGTVLNFLKYLEDKYYDGLIFHRVIDGFMIQGGGFTPDMKQKPGRSPIKNEAKSDVKNNRGTLAMARTGVIDSATSQFYISLVDNNFLNHVNESQQGFGYCVFGKVTKGMDIVDKMGKVQTGARGQFPKDVPVEDVVIKSIRESK